MAFSLFGKKDAPPTKKKTTTGAVERPGDRAREPAPPPASSDNDPLLDFSNYAPPPPRAKSTPPEPPKQAAPQAQKPAAPPPEAAVSKPAGASLPEPVSRQVAAQSIPSVQAPASKPSAAASTPQPVPVQMSAPPAASAAPRAAGAPVPVAATAARAESKATAVPTAKRVAAPPATQETKASAPANLLVPSAEEPPDSIMNIEVTSGAADTARVIEEAAILFANSQFLQALSALTKAVHEGNLGPSALQVWLMLFDLYRSLKMKEEFEALGMKFLAGFERSPPVWAEPEPQFDPALATGGIGYCALAGALSDKSASQLEQLRRMSQGRQAIRIDFAKLQRVDPSGCARLLEVLEVLKKSGKEVVFTGEAHLLRLIEAECQRQNNDTGGALWSLLFEILRRLGMKDRFEETAVNYAVTYELSPPSWESEAGAKPKTGPYVGAAEPAQPAFRLSGDVTGANESLPGKLQDWAKSNSPLVIDMSAVRRVDFVSAGQLLNVFTKLHQAGSTIQIRGANELVAALFDIMGIQEVARIIRNR